MNIYVAGKVSKDSSFGTHYWRDEFCAQLSDLTGIELINLDPTNTGVAQDDPLLVFGCDSHLIETCDVMIANLSDDISVGGSQEILIAKYFNKPVIGLARFGGKFNGSTKKYFGKTYTNYKDPFVFTTCDVVCSTIEEVASALQRLEHLPVKNIGIIGIALKHYRAVAQSS